MGMYFFYPETMIGSGDANKDGNGFRMRRKKLRNCWPGKTFISLMEEEALSLHAMMMTGRPGCCS